MTTFATRRLTVKQGGVEHSVLVTLNAPEPDRTAWICRFEIGWPEGPVRDHGMGFDGVQALFLAMQKISTHLYASAYHQKGHLTWGKPGTGYGFPASRGGRDELVGEDKRHYA